MFIIKALVAAMQQFPSFNASLSPDGEKLILKKYFNIGIAVDTPNGLVVPVLRDVEHKTINQLAIELAEKSEKARQGKLIPADMQGGCMTISSLGGIGGTAFHADSQCARSGDFGRDPRQNAAGLEWQRIYASTHVAVGFNLRPSRD